MPAGGGRIAARFVALPSGEWLCPGEIVWDGGGRIVSVRRWRGPATEDVVVLPGLVDAHAHLQLPALTRAPRDFVPWVGAVMAARAATTPAAERATIRRAVASLLASGATAIGDIDASGRVAAVLAAESVQARCYRELTGFQLDARAARELVRARWRPSPPPVVAGLSPHAPYSVSAALFQAASQRCRHLAIHCAETPEEQRFLRTGSGPFRDLLAQLGRLPADHQPPGVGAVRWLERLGLLRATTQLVHCQELERGDAARIAAAGTSIVVCPGTIAWFRRSLPPVPAWLRAGIPVGLGTDSLASNTTLSMRTELRRAALAWPSLAPSTLLAMATRLGARSLGLAGAGRIRRGARADLVVAPAAATPASTLAAFVHGDLPLLQVLGGGRVRWRGDGESTRAGDAATMVTGGVGRGR